MRALSPLLRGGRGKCNRLRGLGEPAELAWSELAYPGESWKSRPDMLPWLHAGARAAGGVGAVRGVMKVASSSSGCPLSGGADTVMIGRAPLALVLWLVFDLCPLLFGGRRGFSMLSLPKSAEDIDFCGRMWRMLATGMAEACLCGGLESEEAESWRIANWEGSNCEMEPNECEETSRGGSAAGAIGFGEEGVEIERAAAPLLWNNC